MFELIQDKTEDFQDLVEPQRAEREISRVEKDCQNFMIEIETTIQKALDADFLSGLSAIRNDYEKYVVKLLEKEFPATDEADLLEFQKESMKMPEVEELIDNSTEETLTDSYEESDSSWYNPLSWGRTKITNVYGDRVDLKEIWSEINSKLRSAVQGNIDLSNDTAINNAKEGKKIILKSMDDIDQVFTENLNNMKKASISKKENEKQISENNKKLNWYSSFDKELNDILSISNKIAKETQSIKKRKEADLAMV